MLKNAPPQSHRFRIFLPLTTNDETAYKAHCKVVLESFNPVGGMEVQLAQEIAGDRWRLQVASAMDSNICSLGLTQPDAITAHHPEIDTAFARAASGSATPGTEPS